MAVNRILTAHRRSFVSQRALAEILALIPEEDETAATSRQTLKRQRVRKLTQNTPYGPLWNELDGFVMKDGAPLKITYLDPAALLWCSCERGGGFQAFVRDCAGKHPCSPAAPWDLCLYVDEVTPGNQLKPTNDRKLQVVYFSLKQFGGLALSKEDAWFVLTAVRSTDAKRVVDGMAQIMKKVLNIFLVSRRNVLLHGLRLPFPNNQQWALCCKLGSLTAMSMEENRYYTAMTVYIYIYV